jgi:hypothetical protein
MILWPHRNRSLGAGAMIPVLKGLEEAGVNVAALWWALALVATQPPLALLPTLSSCRCLSERALPSPPPCEVAGVYH